MADSVVGALRVLLGIDTAAFSDGLDTASKELNKFGKELSSSLTKAAVAGGAALAGAAGAIGVAVRHSINEMDNLGKLSQKIGIPVEQLSSLKVAADLSDVSVEALSRSMGVLTTAMVKAAAGGTGPATSAFQALGISMQTLKSNDPSVVMAAIAQRFSEFSDGATKSAIASAIFGQRMGRELIPLLNEGAAGLKAAKENAQAFGQVISTETTRQAQTFNDNLKLMALIPSGIANEIASKLLPKLVELSNQMVSWAKDNKVVQTSADALVRVIALVVDNLDYLAKAFAALIAARLALFFVQLALNIYEFAKAIYTAGLAVTAMNLLTSGWVKIVIILAGALLYASGALDDFVKKIGELGGVASSAIGKLDLGDKISKGLEAIGINTRALSGNLAGLETHGNAAADALSKVKPPPAFDPSASANGQKFSDELLKIQLKAREIRGDFDQLAPGFVQYATQLKLIKDTGDGFVGTLDTLTAKQLQLNNALLGLAGAQMIKDAMSPYEEFEKRINLVNAALEKQVINTQTAADAAAKAASKMAENYGQMASTAAGNFAEFFKEFGKGNKTMFAISKAFSISQAIINTAVGVTKALAEGGPILGPILAASIVALGAAQVAKIAAEKPPAMALGGSFQVGGAGGVDSQMVPIMATPGERVSVEQNKYGQNQSGGSVITVQGINAKDYYRGDVLRDLVENLNMAISDGLKIKVA